APPAPTGWVLLLFRVCHGVSSPLMLLVAPPLSLCGVPGSHQAVDLYTTGRQNDGDVAPCRSLTDQPIPALPCSADQGGAKDDLFYLRDGDGMTGTMLFPSRLHD